MYISLIVSIGIFCIIFMSKNFSHSCFDSYQPKNLTILLFGGPNQLGRKCKDIQVVSCLLEISNLLPYISIFHSYLSMQTLLRIEAH